MAKVTPKTKAVKEPVPKAKTVSTVKKKSAAKSKAWDDLAKEMKSLIPKLDEEGLAFLVKQSHIHLYNMQVDALNKTLVKDEKRKKEAAAKKTGNKKEEGFSGIKISDSGSSYYIVYNNEWVAFSRDEMTILVKIIFGEGSDLEIREQLYNWLSRERGDLLNCASIGNKFDDKLKTLVRLLKDNFKLRNK